MAVDSPPDDLLVVHEARRRHLPPLGAYLAEMHRRRRFAQYMARSDLKARHYDTVLGQLWRVVNPLLLALVYYLVLGVILHSKRGSGEYLGSLLAGLFAFYYTQNAVSTGARSIVGAGGLIMNSAFPRALLPASAVISAFLAYLPSLVVYAAFHVALGLPYGWPLVVLPVIVAVQTVFNLGLAMFMAAATVYFRDTSSFLPYVFRVWLYLSPILWAVRDVHSSLRPWLNLNPLSPLLEAWHNVLIEGVFPTPLTMAIAFGWSVLALVVGAWFFLAREREFAVRI